MKARVKATGQIFDENTLVTFFCSEGGDYFLNEIELIPDDDTPDYWTRLEHQYAGMAMQGMLSNEYAHKLYLDNKSYPIGLLNDSITIAHALVEKMKEGK